MRFFILILLLCFTQSARADFWNNITSSISQTAQGNKVMVTCHNCYTSKGDDDSDVFKSDYNGVLADYSANIVSGIIAGADTVELDIFYKNSSWVVAHKPGTANLPNVPLLSDILDISDLNNSGIHLFIEIKDEDVTQDAASTLLGLLSARNYLDTGRIVVFNSFSTMSLLALKEYIPIVVPNEKDQFRLGKLYSNSNSRNLLTWQQDIATLHAAGIDIVGFYYYQPNIFSVLAYAKSLGMGINLYTIGNFTSVFTAAFREEFDSVAIEAGGDRSKAQNLQIAKSKVEEQASNLLYFNMAQQTGNWYSYVDGTGNTSRQLNRFENSMPTYERLGAIGEDRFGSSLVFDSNSNNFIRLHDSDNSVNGGFLINTVVNFDSFPTSNNVEAIISKADAGGFALELSNGLLRFGVNLNGTYHYATTPVSSFNGSDSYHIIAAYDGGGSIRLWVNGKQVGYTSNFFEGVKQNNSPVMLGADPQGTDDQRFYWSGKMQLANIQRWNN